MVAEKVRSHLSSSGMTVHGFGIRTRHGEGGDICLVLKLGCGRDGKARRRACAMRGCWRCWQGGNCVLWAVLCSRDVSVSSGYGECASERMGKGGEGVCEVCGELRNDEAGKLR